MRDSLFRPWLCLAPGAPRVKTKFVREGAAPPAGSHLVHIPGRDLALAQNPTCGPKATRIHAGFPTGQIDAISRKPCPEH